MINLKEEKPWIIFPCEGTNNDMLSNIYLMNNNVLDNITNKIKSDHDTLRIMTYNVHMWKAPVTHSTIKFNENENEYNYDNICNVIFEANPDILCLQEVHLIEPAMNLLFKHYEILSACTIVLCIRLFSSSVMTKINSTITLYKCNICNHDIN
jgi:hypothetical protein